MFAQLMGYLPILIGFFSRCMQYCLYVCFRLVYVFYFVFSVFCIVLFIISPFVYSCLFPVLFTSLTTGDSAQSVETTIFPHTHVA
jgi:hypothetical protein